MEYGNPSRVSVNKSMEEVLQLQSYNNSRLIVEFKKKKHDKPQTYIAVQETPLEESGSESNRRIEEWKKEFANAVCQEVAKCTKGKTNVDDNCPQFTGSSRYAVSKDSGKGKKTLSQGQETFIRGRQTDRVAD
ncbi:uncharacterized protein LOC110654307 isoform X1 [Hevea brasiliensis]|uniref:uncharacterized protein LOC110654307 isoform X1 n=1 Tax=Hevea brasiliensis TaxID=3981 RepID=UPI0025E0FDDE|nr:uncharacterized protein LOC110654307 isoform X1 [Hevea brasiliensis]